MKNTLLIDFLEKRRLLEEFYRHLIKKRAVCDFSVSKARKGGVVKTIEGHDVEIICYDLRNSNPSIVGCVKTERGNLFLLYNDKGVAVNFNHRNYDLKIEIDTFKNKIK